MRKSIPINIAPLFNHSKVADQFNFDLCRIEAGKLDGVTFSNGVIVGSSAREWELLNSQFVDSHLRKSEFFKSSFEDVEFRNCKFVEFDFRQCKLKRVTFTNCYLFQMSIDGSHVEELHFQDCNFITSSFHTSEVKSLTIDECQVTAPPGWVWDASGIDEQSLKTLRDHEFQVLD